MQLSDIKHLGSYQVEAIETDAARQQRLTDFGIMPGVELIVKGFAPLGDPLLIEVNDQMLALRRYDAQGIKIK